MVWLILDSRLRGNDGIVVEHEDFIEIWESLFEPLRTQRAQRRSRGYLLLFSTRRSRRFVAGCLREGEFGGSLPLIYADGVKMVGY